MEYVGELVCVAWLEGWRRGGYVYKRVFVDIGLYVLSGAAQCRTLSPLIFNSN